MSHMPEIYKYEISIYLVFLPYIVHGEAQPYLFYLEGAQSQNNL